MNVELEFHEKKCSKCGKGFIAGPEWAYRHGKGYNALLFCSWGCLRAWEKSRGSKIDRREQIIQAIYDGKSIEEIVNTLHVDRSNVLYWQRKLEAV